MQPIITRYEVNCNQKICLSLKKCYAAQHLPSHNLLPHFRYLFYSAAALKVKNSQVTFCSYCIFMKQIQLNDTFAISNTKINLDPTNVCVMSDKLLLIIKM